MPGPCKGRRRLLGLALVVFTLHALLFAEWLIDDAGISFAYARSLAQGHGLTAQAGVPPVEGFSNPLWTVLLAAFVGAGLFDPLWTPKLVSLLLVSIAFVLLAGNPRRPLSWAVALPLLLLPLNTSFVVWTTSGLENGLLVVLVVVSAVLAGRAFERERAEWPVDAGSGLVAGLLALTRPDALAYVAPYPAVLGIRALRDHGGDGLRPRLGAFAAGALPLAAGYLLFRRGYFGDWVPNTYHAKEKPSLYSLLDVDKLQDVLASATGPLAAVTLILLVAGAYVSWRGRGLRSPLLVPSLYLGIATAAYLLLPEDWMGEYRFATAFFVFLPWTLGSILDASRAAFPHVHWRRPASVLLAAALLTQSLLSYPARSLAFAAQPVVPFERVADFSGRGYNRLARILGEPRASLLTPDLGGTLYYSNLRVYDLAGLCDRAIAHTLKADREAFLRYVFEETRPTFIHAHASWAEWADFEADPRLRRDYAVILERREGPAEWRAQAPAHVPWSADYVRKDALGADADMLPRLREAFLAQGMPALSP